MSSPLGKFRKPDSRQDSVVSAEWPPEWPQARLSPELAGGPSASHRPGLDLARRRSSFQDTSQLDYFRFNLSSKPQLNPPNVSNVSNAPKIAEPVMASTPDISITETTSLLEGGPSLISPATTFTLPRHVKQSQTGPSWWDILSCTLAYFISSLFVFSDMGKILGSTGSKHFVATTSIYFHPARPMGAIIESCIFTAAMLVFSVIVGTASMATSHFLITRGLVFIDYTVVLILFIGGGAAAIGFLKMYMNNTSFNTACSVASIFLVSILLKEDDVQAGELSSEQFRVYLLMVTAGVTISTVVSLVFRRKSATLMLNTAIDELMAQHSDMLQMLLDQFMARDVSSESKERYQEASGAERASLQKIKQLLAYAKLELFFIGRRNRYNHLAELVNSLQRQSLHLGGLSHCNGIKDQLLNPSLANLVNTTMDSSFINTSLTDNLATLSTAALPGKSYLSGDILFQAFLYHLGPPMKGHVKNTVQALGSKSKDSLESSLASYSEQREKALNAVYNHRLFGPQGSLCSNADESLLATCGMFSSLLKYYAEEVIELLEIRQGYYDCTPLPDHYATQATGEKMPFSKVTEALYPTNKAPSGRASAGFGPQLWRFLRLLRRVDVQHGLRMGFGAIIISLPAFLESARPTFELWHGEWAVITYMIIMARNFGAMSKNIPLRIIGTTTGAIVAIAVSLLFNGQPVYLALSGCTVAWFCFRRILGDQKPILGRFVLLTYNLVCLYSFSVSHHDYDPNDPEFDKAIYDVAFHRVTAVLLGVLWAVFMTVSIWPHSARRALRTNLSIQWMRMGMAWKADPIGTAGPPRKDKRQGARLRGISGETELQNVMLELGSLLEQSPAEFRLRGKFDPEPYRHLVADTQVILDAFHSISLLIDEDPIATANEMALIEFTHAERKELAEMLFLHFYTASASVRMGFPVPEHLPQPHDAVARLVKKLQERRSDTLGATGSTEMEDFVLLYSYLMVTLTITEQLLRINRSLTAVFGSLDADLFSYV